MVRWYFHRTSVATKALNGAIHNCAAAEIPEVGAFLLANGFTKQTCGVSKHKTVLWLHRVFKHVNAIVCTQKLLCNALEVCSTSHGSQMPDPSPWLHWPVWSSCVEQPRAQNK